MAVGAGVGVAVGAGVGVAVGAGVGVAVGLGCGVGDGDGEGVGVTTGVGDGNGEDVADSTIPIMLPEGATTRTKLMPDVTTLTVMVTEVFCCETKPVQVTLTV